MPNFLQRAVASIRAAFSSFPATISPGVWGGAGTNVHEPYAGAWQESSRELSPKSRSSPLAFSAVYTCINVISSDIAKLPLRIMRDRPKGGGREEHVNHPLTRLLKKPNRYQTSLQFLQHYLSSKLWTGNTYVLLVRDARGVVSEMYVIDPRTVQPAITEEGDVWYLLKSDKLNRLPEDIYIPSRDILHDRAVPLFHPLIGVSPLYAAGVSANIGNSITGHAEQFFSNLSRTSGVLTAPGEIPEAVAKRLKKDWDGNYSGSGFGKVAVLGNGLDWKPLTMTAVDAQLIDQLRWTVEDVGRVYRVPAFMLGETKITYRNSEQLARMYFQGCLSYHIEAIEQCYQEKFELGRSDTIEFDLGPLFRMETDLRYDTHQKALQSGIKSINEVRAEEDLPPVKGGEEPRLQMQYVPISLAGKPPEPGAPTPAPAPAPAPAPEDPEEPADPEDPAPAPVEDSLSTWDQREVDEYEIAAMYDRVMSSILGQAA